MVITAIAESVTPMPRRLLLKADAIEGDQDAIRLHDTFHVDAPLDNAEAKQTLANPKLTSIEVAHCLWHDFGNARPRPVPAGCRCYSVR